MTDNNKIGAIDLIKPSKKQVFPLDLDTKDPIHRDLFIKMGLISELTDKEKIIYNKHFLDPKRIALIKELSVLNNLVS